MRVIDAYVHSRNEHRRNLDNPSGRSPFVVACPRPKPDVRILLTLGPQHVIKATTFEDGPFKQIEELASLRVKPQILGAPSPSCPMEGYISCLARLSQPKDISRMQEVNRLQQHC